MSSAYERATSTAGLILLPQWSVLEVTGRDRALFLHNMCTNDIRSLQPGQGCEAFFTDVKGRIVGHGFFLLADESIVVLMVPEQSAKLIAHLDRYIIREDVALADRTADFAWTLVIGARAVELVERIAPGTSAKLAINWSHTEPLFAGAATQVVKCELPWCGGVLLRALQTDAALTERALGEAGAERYGDDVWHAVRIESGWPLYGVDFDSENLPQEVARDAQAISFRKGCYLGQETVARIDALGHVNRQLATVRFDGAAPMPGVKLIAGDKTVGRVTSTCWSPQVGAALGLAMLRRVALDKGAALSYSGQGVEVVPTPAIHK